MEDHSFAANFGVPFSTPEEHFPKVVTQKFDKPSFDSSQTSSSIDLYDNRNVKVPAHKVELVVLCSFPG